MMKTRPIHWSEGMLVLPHHFQAAQAHVVDSLATAEDLHSAYNYGVRIMEMNLEALKNFEARIPRLRARMKDGTLVCVPENAHLDTLDLKPTLGGATTAYLHLLIPEAVAGKANAPREATDDNHRYRVDVEEWEDRNDGGNPRAIETQRLNARLAALPTLESPRGFDSIPLGRLRRAQQAESPPELDKEYIPPLLACDAWTSLRQDVLVAISSQLGGYMTAQANYLLTRGGWSEANQPQVRKAILKLNAVNGAQPYLSQLADARGVHPFLAYTELCRVVGQLGIFRDAWIPPELPKYDHDDLGRIFREVKLRINEALQEESGPKQQRLPFTGVQEWMEVALDPQWLMGRHDFYIGVKSDLPSNKVEQIFSNRWLDWKLGSARTIASIVRSGQTGLGLARVPGVHPSLPALNDYTYFRVDASGQRWREVEEDRRLALWVNPNYVKKEFVGQKTFTVIDPGNKLRDLGLDLWIEEKA